MTTALHTQIRTMLSMQEAMNAKVNPDWRAQNYKWYRAIWTEMAETVEALNSWKWWKKNDPHMEQAVMELIDIWHFGLSDMMMTHPHDYESIVESAVKAFTQKREPETDLTSLLEDFVEVTLIRRGFDVDLFAAVLASFGVTTDALYRSYIGKNTLNLFRQGHQYKEGGYVKIWDGREDNEHMTELLDRFDTASETYKDDLYAALEQRYRELCQSS